MRVRETGMPRRRASVAERVHHATVSVVLNTLSQHRLQSRRQKGSLQQLRVQLRTRCRYNDAVAGSIWLHDESQSPDKDGLDAQLCEYLEWLWHEGAHVGWAGDAISGCQFFFQKKRYFPAAWELLRTWKREELPLQAPPLTGPIVFALIAAALAWHLTDVAVLIAIGYGGFLRTMEALTLQRSQITAHSSCVLLTLPITKTGKRIWRNSNVINDDLLLVSMINRSLCMLCPSDYLLQRSPHSFRTIFTALLSALELGSFHFSPYSLRRGDWMLHRNMDSTIEKCRWPSVKTARIYLKESIAVYIFCQYSFNSLPISTNQGK